MKRSDIKFWWNNHQILLKTVIAIIMVFATLTLIIIGVTQNF